MYKNFVIGLSLIIIWISGYYILHSGGAELISNAYNTEAGSNFNPPTNESIKGIYSCGIDTGCNNRYIILLREDQTLQLLTSSGTVSELQSSPITSNDDNTPSSDTTINSLEELVDKSSDNSSSSIRKGTWTLVQGNMLILIIDEEGEKMLEKPQRFVVGKVGSSILSKITYNKDQFKDMVKPIFIKQEY